MFLKISQNSQENTCTRVSFLIKLQQENTCVGVSAKFLRTSFFQNTSGGCFWLVQCTISKRPKIVSQILGWVHFASMYSVLIPENFLCLFTFSESLSMFFVTNFLITIYLAKRLKLWFGRVSLRNAGIAFGS